MTVRTAPSQLARRTERVRIYSYTTSVTSGRVTESYTFAQEVWASFSPRLGSAPEVTRQGGAQHDRLATFGFHERVTIDEKMVLTVNGQAYRVTGVADPRTFVDGMLREVEAMHVDQSEFTLTEP